MSSANRWQLYLRWWLLKPRKTISPFNFSVFLRKHFLYHLNHIHIWMVERQLSCGECQIRTWYLIENQCFDRSKTTGKITEHRTTATRTVLLTWLNFNPSMDNNHMCSKMSYPLPNVHGCNVEVWEWMSNLIPHFIMCIIVYPYCH